MKATFLVDYYSIAIGQEYKKGQVVKVEEFKGIDDSYAIYRDDKRDWIPKKMVRII